MNEQQLSIFEPWRKPLPFDTSTVAKRLGVSPSTLNRYKKQGKPFIKKIEGGSVSVEYAGRRGRCDFWQVFYWE